MRTKKKFIAALLCFLILILILTGDLFAHKATDYDPIYIASGFIGAVIFDMLYSKLNLEYPLLKSITTTLFVSLTKEFFDEMYKYTGKKEHSFWDRRGFNYKDVLRAGTGGLIYISIKIIL